MAGYEGPRVVFLTREGVVTAEGKVRASGDQNTTTNVCARPYKGAVRRGRGDERIEGGL